MSQTPLSAGISSSLRDACADLIRRLRSDDEARAEQYFEAVPALGSDAESAIELIYTEFATREELGRRPDAAEYLRRFPQWQGALERQFDIHRLLNADDSAGAANRDALDEPKPKSRPTQGISGVVEKSAERFGAYEIVRTLGRGGMGTVYLATHVELGRLAAVKILNGSGNSSGAALAERFRTEVRSAAALGHPQIVQLYELGETPDGRLFAAFEYVEGGSLAAALAGRPRAAREAAELVRLLASALDRAHKAGIVHCDLTPANILLTREGQPKIADFGLAKLPKSAAALEEKTAAQATTNPLAEASDEAFADDADYAALSSVALAGTPGYLAPERIENPAEVTPAADIYGLGAVFYELLTGRPPHVGATPLETLRQARDYDPPSPRELVPNLPRDCATICLKCLERDPQRRYHDAAALAEDLRRFLAGEPIAARPVGALERAWKWAGRHQGWAAALAATTTAIVLLAVGATLYNIRLREMIKTEARQKQQIAEQAAKVEGQLEALNRTAYTMQLNQAEALVDRAPHQSLALLRDVERCPPELRDFAWGMLLRRASQDRRTLLGHAAAVRAVTQRSDGTLVTVALDDTVRHWPEAHIATGGGESTAATSSQQFDVVTAAATAVALSPDGNRLAAAFEDRSIKLWNFPARPTPRVLVGPTEAIIALEFFDGGRWLAAADDSGVLRLWDPAGNPITAWSVAEPGTILSLAASPDDKTLAVGLSDGRILLVDSVTGPIRNVGEAEVQPELAGKLDGVAQIRYSPDGKRLVAVGVLSNKIELWNVAERTLDRTIEVGASAARSAALSGDGRYLAYATSEQVLAVVDLASGETTAEYRGHTERIGALRFTADDKAVVSVSDDRTVKLWDVPGERVPRVVAGDALKTLAVAYSADGRTTAIAGFDGTIRLSRTADSTDLEPALLKGHGAGVHALRFLPGDKRLLSCGEDNTVRLWNLADGANVKTWQQPTWVMDIVVTPDGRACYAAGSDGHVRVILLDESAPRPVGERRVVPESFDIQAHDNSITSLALNPANMPRPGESPKPASSGIAADLAAPLLFTASRDGTVKAWNAYTGAAVGTSTGHPATVLSLAYSLEAKRLAAGDESGCVTIWEGGVVEPRVLRGHSKGVYAVAFSPDGRIIASASGGPWVQAGGEVKLWDVVGGQVHATLDGYSAPLAFRGDGLSLAVGLDPRRQIAFWPALPYENEPIPAPISVPAASADRASAPQVPAGASVPNQAK